MLAIYKREMRSYFTTPIGYIYMAIFLAVEGFLFAISTLQVQSADVGTYFQFMMYSYIVIVPLLTMKSFAEEKKMKTEQLILTSPVRLSSMVGAKFAAALTMFMTTVILSSVAYIPLAKYATNPNFARVLGCNIGIVLIGICFISVGLFMSSLTENQFVAASSTMALLLALVMVSVINNLIDSAPVRTVLDWVSIYSRFSPFTFGIFDVASVVYYLSLCFVFLFLTVRVYERRRTA